MNDNSNQSDQAERIRALQARRAASARLRPTPAAESSSTRANASKRRPRRRHAAAGTRIFLAGLSVSSFFAVAGAIGLAHRTTTTAQAVTTSIPVGTASAGGAGATPGAASARVVNTVTKAS